MLTLICTKLVQGTHESLKNNQNAKATVTAIIDGTGSLGAAFGPLLVGWITSDYVRESVCWKVLNLIASLTFAELFNPVFVFFVLVV